MFAAPIIMISVSGFLRCFCWILKYFCWIRKSVDAVLHKYLNCIDNNEWAAFNSHTAYGQLGLLNFSVFSILIKRCKNAAKKTQKTRAAAWKSREWNPSGRVSTERTATPVNGVLQICTHTIDRNEILEGIILCVDGRPSEEISVG